MKRTAKDFQQDLLLKIVKPLVYIWMFFDAKRKVIVDSSFQLNTKEPYVLLSNHTFMFDVVHVPLRLKITPFIIASQTLFTKQPAKFFVKEVAHVIPKSKGKSDSRAIMKVFQAVKRGYPILIFPEGDNTFYGETNYIEESTMKLIKKLNVDVITCQVRGGYLSRPRWATGKRKNRRIELFYKKEISKEELSSLSVDEINQRVVKALYYNAYEDQRTKMIPHPGKQHAEGIENAVYVCPHCESINSIESNGNEIHCNVCKHTGYIDEFGFIHDFVFDNLVDWDHYQRYFKEKLKDSVIESKGKLYRLNVESGKNTFLGEDSLRYENGYLTLENQKDMKMDIEAISNPILTLRRDFFFTYHNEDYLMKLDQYAATFLRVCQDKY